MMARARARLPLLLLLRPETMRGPASWQGLMTAAVTRKFSDGSGSQLKTVVYQHPKPEERSNKIKSVGSFKTFLGAYGPLMDGPDYTFMDGRPTPLRGGQMRRAMAQRKAAAKVLQLMKETEFAIQREQQLRQEKQQKKQHFHEAKLMAKGHRMLQKREK